jgi:hypothetical protein
MARCAIEDIIKELTVDPGNEAKLNQIIPGLWLGNEQALNDSLLSKKDIKTIINVSDSKIIAPRNVDQYCYCMIDRWACQSNAMNLIDKCAYLIDLCIRDGISVMVYCKRGHHRSACVVLHYLIKYRGINILEAMRTIKLQRPTALRRISCMLDNLIDYHSS